MQIYPLAIVRRGDHAQRCQICVVYTVRLGMVRLGMVRLGTVTQEAARLPAPSVGVPAE